MHFRFVVAFVHFFFIIIISNEEMKWITFYLCCLFCLFKSTAHREKKVIRPVVESSMRMRAYINNINCMLFYTRKDRLFIGWHFSFGSCACIIFLGRNWAMKSAFFFCILSYLGVRDTAPCVCAVDGRPVSQWNTHCFYLSFVFIYS